MAAFENQSVSVAVSVYHLLAWNIHRSKISWGLQLSLQNKENISVSVARVLLRTYTHKSPQTVSRHFGAVNRFMVAQGLKLENLTYCPLHIELVLKVSCLTPLNHCHLKIS